MGGGLRPFFFVAPVYPGAGVTTTPKNPDLFKVPSPGKPVAGAARAADIVNSQGSRPKAKRRLPYSVRFEYWRTTEGLSLGKIAARLEERARDFGIEAPYLLTRLMELEQGRYKAPAWLMFLLQDAYGLKFPWWEFWDGAPS